MGKRAWDSVADAGRARRCLADAAPGHSLRSRGFVHGLPSNGNGTRNFAVDCIGRTGRNRPNGPTGRQVPGKDSICQGKTMWPEDRPVPGSAERSAGREVTDRGTP